MFFSCYDRVHGYVAAVWTSCSLPASSLDLQCGSVLWAGLWFLSGSSLVTLWFLWFLSGSSGSSGSSLVPLVPLWFLWAGLWFRSVLCGSLVLGYLQCQCMDTWPGTVSVNMFLVFLLQNTISPCTFEEV